MALAAMSVMPFYSCSDSDDSSSNSNIYVFPADAAATYIAVAFCNNSGGVNFHMEKAANIATRLTSGTFDSVFTVKILDTTATIQYDYDVHYTASYITGTPPKVSFDYTATGAFHSTYMSSNDQQNAQYYISGINPGDPNPVMNGNGGDGGTQISGSYKVAFTSSFNYTLKDIQFDKQTFWITSGTATIHIDGIGPANIPFSFGGNITFTGDRKATMVLDGKSYYMNLVTGGWSK